MNNQPENENFQSSNMLIKIEQHFKQIDGRQRMLQAQNYQANNNSNALNYVTCIIFIITIVVFIVLIKHYLAKFISFFILRKDYLRMKCVEKINSEHKIPSRRNSLLQNSLNTISMNNQEFRQEYKKKLMLNINIYHPIIGLCPSRFIGSLRNIIRLPKSIISTLLISTFLLTLTLALSLNQALCIQINCQYDFKNLSILCAVIETLVIILVTYMISNNYIEFLVQCRNPCDNNQVILSNKNEGASDQYNSSRQDSVIDKRLSLHQSINEEPQNYNNTVQPQQQNIYLHSIKEDDEEQPFSPEKQSLDDIGSDEVGPNNQKHTIEKGNVLPSLGLIRKVQNQFHNAAAILNSAKTIPINGNKVLMMNDVESIKAFTNQSGLNATAEANNETQQRSKTMSQSNVSHHNNSQMIEEEIVIRDLQEEEDYESHQNQIGINQSTYRNSSRRDLINSRQSKHRSDMRPSESIQQRHTPGQFSRVFSAPGQDRNALNSSNNECVYLQQHFSAVNHFSNKGKIIPQDSGTPGLELYQTTAFKNPSFEFKLQLVSTKQGSTPLKFPVLLIGGILILALTLTPLYVIHQLSTLNLENLKSALMCLFYSILIDFFLLRPLSIIIMSFVQVKRNLRVIQNSSGVVQTHLLALDDDQLNLLGQFYQEYEQGLISFHLNEFPIEALDEEGEDRERIRSPGFSYAQSGKLIQKTLTKQRIHDTRCPDIVFIETVIQEPEIVIQPNLRQVENISLKRLSEPGGIVPDEENIGIDGNYGDTSHRLIDIKIQYNEKDKSSSHKSYKTPGGKDQNQSSYRIAPQDEYGNELKMNRPTTILRNQQHYDPYDQNYDTKGDDIEEIDALSGTKNVQGIFGLEELQIGPNLEIVTEQFVIPTINMQKLHQINDSMIIKNNNVSQHHFETPKVSVHEGVSSSHQNSKIQYLQGQTIRELPQNPCEPASELVLPDPDENLTLLDQKKKLLRDLILEASSAGGSRREHKGLLPETSRDEYTSLKKYLAEESQEADANDSKDIIPIHDKKKMILNDSDIAALWHSAQKNEPNTVKNVQKQFSPQYSSGTKSTRQQLIQHEFNLKKVKDNENIDKTQRAEIVSFAKKLNSKQDTQSKQGTISAGYSSEELINGSFRQNALRSSSQNTNLLRSVLSQNRENDYVNEQLDMSLLIKQSQANNKSFTSPLREKSFEKQKTQHSQSIVLSKQNEQEDNYKYEDVRIQELKEQKAANSHHSKANSSKIDNSNLLPNLKKEPISIVQFQSELDRMPMEEQFEKLISKKEENNSSKFGSIVTVNQPEIKHQQYYYRSFNSQSPPKFIGKPPSNLPLKPKLLNVAQKKKPESTQNIFKIEKNFEPLKESAEFGKISSNNVLIDNESPDKQLEEQAQKRYHEKRKPKVPRVVPMNSRRPFNPIIEEASVEMNNLSETPTPSPPKKIGRNQNKATPKAISFVVMNDNQFIGDTPNETPEMQALRRSKLSQSPSGNHSFRTSSHKKVDLSQPDGYSVKAQHFRNFSNFRATTTSSNTNEMKNRTTSSQNTRKSNVGSRQQKKYSPNKSNTISNDIPIVKIEKEPVVYNLHLKQQEALQRQKSEQEINVYIMEEQRRHLKKFLQLARQLRKDKDEKKIILLIANMKESGRPLPIQQVNELRMLEIMSSPYNQSLQGMIKVIENAITQKPKVENKQIPQIKRLKQSRVDTALQSDTQSLNRGIVQAMSLYQPEHRRSGSMSRDSQSQEGLNGSLIIGKHYKPPEHIRSSSAEISPDKSQKRQKQHAPSFSRIDQVALDIVDQLEPSPEENKNNPSPPVKHQRIRSILNSRNIPIYQGNTVSSKDSKKKQKRSKTKKSKSKKPKNDFVIDERENEGQLYEISYREDKKKLGKVMFQQLEAEIQNTNIRQRRSVLEIEGDIESSSVNDF